jgi:hypothetical protein
MNNHLQSRNEILTHIFCQRSGEEALCFNVRAYIYLQLLHFLLIDRCSSEQSDSSVFILGLLVLEDSPLMSVVDELYAPEHMIER